jgi:hypothetical protein
VNNTDEQKLITDKPKDIKQAIFIFLLVFHTEYMGPEVVSGPMESPATDVFCRMSSTCS